MGKAVEIAMKHIRDLVPYSSARDDFKGRAEVYLDANENWKGEGGLNRYPDPEAKEVREKIAEVWGIPMEMSLVTNGSDEAIDLLLRIFSEPFHDRVMITRPTYGAYKVFADINGLSVIDITQDKDLKIDVNGLIKAIHYHRPKVLFLCSPNNPTGKVIPLLDIKRISDANAGITCIDEAYADYARDFDSAVSLIKENDRVVVLRTMSKAWSLAGARIGVVIGDPSVIALFRKTKAPYNVSSLDQKAALEALMRRDEVERIVGETISERERLVEEMKRLFYVLEVIEGEANFLLLRVKDATRLYEYLMSRSIIVRNRSREPRLEGCLRITVGSVEENSRLLEALCGYEA